MSDNLNILILEDRQTDADLMVHELKRAGFEFEWIRVASRSEFVAQLEGDWDIILADYSLPQFNALEALKELLARQIDIPFIIVTGSVSEEVAVECMKLGAADYLLKDRLARLGGAVRRALDERKLRLEKESTEGDLRKSEARYRSIFDSAAVSIWEEDFSMVKSEIDRITADSEIDFREYLDEHPEFVTAAGEMIKVRDVNIETLNLFGARNKDELIVSLSRILTPATYSTLKEELIAIAEGRKFFTGETKNRTLDGREIDVLVTVSIPQEANRFDRVLVSMMDITERKALEQQSQRLLKQQIAANQLALALGESHKLDDLYQIIHRHIKELMDVYAFTISFYDPKTLQISAAYVIIEEKEIDASQLQTIPLADSSAGIQSRVIRTGEAYYSADYLKSLEKTKSKYDVEKNSSLQDATLNADQGGPRSAIYVPIKDKGDVIGVMEVQSDQTDAYSSDDIDLLSTLANVAAIAIQNARLFSESQRQLEEMELVSRVSTALREAEALDEILPIFLDETLAIIGTSSGSVAVYDEGRQEFVYQSIRGWFERLGDILPPVDEGISGQVLNTGKLYIFQDFANDPLVKPNIRKLTPHNWGGACLPIYGGKVVTGLMYISIQHPRQLTANEISLLVTLTEIVGVAIHRTRLHDQTRTQLQRLAASRAIDAAINASMDMRIFIDVFLDQAKTQLDVDMISLFVLDPFLKVLNLAGSIGFRTDLPTNLGLELGKSLAGKAALTGEIIAIPNLEKSGESIDQLKMIESENIVGYFAVPLFAKGKVKGVLEAMHRSERFPNQDWLDYLNTLAGQAALAIDNTSLFKELQVSNQELALAYDNTLEGWARALELRDMETEGHSRRVVDLVMKIAREMGIAGQDLTHLRRGALLHDIGKMGVPDSILQKPGALTKDEWQIMRQHPIYAFEMLSPITFLRPALDIPYCHHEKWDGTGYPRQLEGDQIPLSARIFAVVDVWDALLSDRPYRKAWSEDKVLKYLRDQSGKHFDPEVLEIFLRFIE